jgi:hypothetical protein
MRQNLKRGWNDMGEKKENILEGLTKKLNIQAPENKLDQIVREGTAFAISQKVDSSTNKNNIERIAEQTLTQVVKAPRIQISKKPVEQKITATDQTEATAQIAATTTDQTEATAQTAATTAQTEATTQTEATDQTAEVITHTKGRKIGQVTPLLFYRKYNTYQVLLEAHPQNDMTIQECYSKIILYIISWFKNRIGEDNLKSVKEISFLNTDYPEISSYKDFDIEKVSDINALAALDVKTAYDEEKKGWVFQLVEPDNGNDNKNISGRVFTTGICVYRQEKTVVFGTRVSCKEPSTNQQDAAVYRPGFVKSIANDADIVVTEVDVPKEYSFKISPIHVNGKSGVECNNIYNNLICCPDRQLPVLFIPGKFYDEVSEEIQERIKRMAQSFLGFCHVVIWDKSPKRLFDSCMKSEELLEVAQEGDIIFYRNNPSRQKNLYNSDGSFLNYADLDCTYYDVYEEDLFKNLEKEIRTTDPLRRNYDFERFPLVADRWDLGKIIEKRLIGKNIESEDVKLIEMERDEIKEELENQKNDNENLQKRNNELELENTRLDKANKDINSSYLVEISKLRKMLDKKGEDFNEVQAQNKKFEEEIENYKDRLNSAGRCEKGKYLPLIYMPCVEKKVDDKIEERILKWIDDYYEDTIIVHENARTLFKKNKKNFDWHRFCMMIHYLSGYTKYRNSGGIKIDKNAARDYDPEEYGMWATPTSSGDGGAANIYKEKYTIDISKYHKEKNKKAILDLHLASGKGRDSDMIRIYFYYDAELKKSIIGNMSEHLPTRSDAH